MLKPTRLRREKITQAHAHTQREESVIECSESDKRMWVRAERFSAHAEPVRLCSLPTVSHVIYSVESLVQLDSVSVLSSPAITGRSRTDYGL